MLGRSRAAKTSLKRIAWRERQSTAEGCARCCNRFLAVRSIVGMRRRAAGLQSGSQQLARSYGGSWIRLGESRCCPDRGSHYRPTQLQQRDITDARSSGGREAGRKKKPRPCETSQDGAALAKTHLPVMSKDVRMVIRGRRSCKLKFQEFAEMANGYVSCSSPCV